MQKALLKSDSGLRLMQQQLVRSDPDPKAIADGSSVNGWHMDTAYLPRHYATVPQQNVHHVVTCLNKVESGGAAFMVVPGAFRFAKEYTAAMPAAEQDALRDSDFRTKLRPELLSQIDTSPGVELLMNEGDACVFDQMSCVSSPPCALPQPLLLHTVADHVRVVVVHRVHSASTQSIPGTSRCKCSRSLCVFFRSSKQRLHRRPLQHVPRHLRRLRTPAHPRRKRRAQEVPTGVPRRAAAAPALPAGLGAPGGSGGEPER